MKVLVIGSGGREHAIAWKVKQNEAVAELYATPGNAGIAEIADCVPAGAGDPASLASLAQSLDIDLTVVGPEAPLVAGVVERFTEQNLRIVGPSSKAARLEGSKIFAKQFMQRHSIPTARFCISDSPATAIDAARQHQFPFVVKADGLAAGKGVCIVTGAAEFEGAINRMMVERVFGDAGARVVLEECLVGREASLMLFTDGRDYRILAPARDFKRVFDDDQGPNTGGMGSYSTPGLIDDGTLRRIEREIIEPTLEGMASEGSPFEGILYVGLMFTETGPRVIEYNARLGDPETQAVMMRLDTDLVEICDAILERRIGSKSISWSADSTVCVVAASAGYPGSFAIGKPVSGLTEAGRVKNVVVFHAGTAKDDAGRVVTSGGRVLGVTAGGANLTEARGRAYDALKEISFDGIHYRRDIAAS
jgi:phosphoribosylamine--glycine ligase